MLYICEDKLQAAFMNMINKLISCRCYVLEPLLESLTAADCFSSQDRIAEINRLLEVNMEKRRNLLDLFSQGYLEAPVYRQENNVLETEADALTAERDALTHSVHAGVGSREELEKLNRFCVTEKPLSDFHDELVERFMEKAVINSREKVTFVLKCGLQLTERI